MIQIKCLEKTNDCNSMECTKIVDCKPDEKHCYAVVKKGSMHKLSYTEPMPINKFDITLAGCWSGSDECKSPSEFAANVKNSTYNFVDPTNQNYQLDHNHIKSSYKIPETLLMPSIQDGCIMYSDEGLVNYWTTSNQSHCCCGTPLCNDKVFFTNEKNPFITFAESISQKHLEDKIANRHIAPNSTNNKYINHGFWLFTLTSTCLVILILFLFLFIFYRKKWFFFKYFKQQDQNNLPPILYSKKNSLPLSINNINNNNDCNNINNNSHQQRHNHNNHHIVSNNESENHQNKINEYLRNSNINNNMETLLTQTQPLLLTASNNVLQQQSASVFASSMIAPNVQVMSSDIFKTSNQNHNKLFKTILAQTNAQAQTPMNHPNDEHIINDDNIRLNYNNDNGSIDETVYNSSHGIDENFSDSVLPRNLNSSDIILLNKIAIGQFSSVWKGSFKRSDDEDPKNPVNDQEPYYAVKIFGLQKSAWLNEKDIYNCLYTSNENILRYYGAFMAKQNTQNKLANEYWLITEYHSNGSLYDYLKIKFLNWKQMISICHSILEGLAYLHSENTDCSYAGNNKKTYAIAHRDLKSKNILVKSNGHSCCIGDFGLALKLNNSNKLSSAEIRSKVGTRRYMSPELIEGAIAFTKETFLRIDVYACALTLWEVISRGDFYEEKCDYKLPFEDEVGLNPSLEDMKEVVVDKSLRPVIKSSWLNHYPIKKELIKIAQTIEECWDIDLDARISSTLAASRVRKIIQNISTS